MLPFAHPVYILKCVVFRIRMEEEPSPYLPHSKIRGRGKVQRIPPCRWIPLLVYQRPVQAGCLVVPDSEFRTASGEIYEVFFPIMGKAFAVCRYMEDCCPVHVLPRHFRISAIESSVSAVVRPEDVDKATVWSNDHVTFDPLRIGPQVLVLLTEGPVVPV